MNTDPAYPPARPSGRSVTPLVRWSFGLDAAFVLFLVLFFALVSSGQRGGTTFFSNPWLSATLLLAGSSAVAGTVIAVVALVRPRDRSVALIVPILLGLFVLYFALGEFIGG